MGRCEVKITLIGNVIRQHFDGFNSHARLRPIKAPLVLQKVSRVTPKDARHSPSPCRLMHCSVSMLAISTVVFGPVIAPQVKRRTTNPNGPQSHHFVRAIFAPHFGHADAGHWFSSITYINYFFQQLNSILLCDGSQKISDLDTITFYGIVFSRSNNIISIRFLLF